MMAVPSSLHAMISSVAGSDTILHKFKPKLHLDVVGIFCARVRLPVTFASGLQLVRVEGKAQEKPLSLESSTSRKCGFGRLKAFHKKCFEHMMFPLHFLYKSSEVSMLYDMHSCSTTCTRIASYEYMYDNVLPGTRG